MTQSETEHEGAARRLKELEGLLEACPGVAYRCTADAHWRADFVGQRIVELTGHPASRFLSGELAFADIVHPADRPFVDVELSDAIAAGRPYHVRYRICTKDGEVRWVEDHGEAQRDTATGEVTHFAGFVRDATQEHVMEGRLRLFESSLSDATDAVLITDAEPLEGGGPKILWVNEAFTEATGYRGDEVIGKSPRILQGPESPREPLDRLRSAMKRWEPATVEVLNYRKDGSTFWSEITVRPVADETGWFTHWVSLQRDISVRKEAERAAEERAEWLRKAKEDAERAAQAKASFLATMSHEIRTPLNGILGMASLLFETPLTAEQRDHLTTIRASGDTLLTVINDILDFSKLDAGRVELEVQPFDLLACVESALELVAVAARRKGVAMQHVVAPEVPQWVQGDATRLRQVLVNLLGNAVKFTDEGEVLLSVHAGAEPGQVVLSVHDTGIGISEDQQARLFQAFTQADASITRRFGGTGLGLAICKRLVERMGGVIGVESLPGQGSTFRFDVRVPSVAAKESPLDDAARRALGGRRVVLSLDHLPAEAFAREVFRRAGAEIVEAAAPDGGNVDIVVGPPGAAAVGPAGVRHVALEARVEASADALMLPLRREPLLRTVLRGLGESLPEASQLSSDAGLEAYALRVLLVEDNVVNQKVATKLLERIGIHPDVAGNGAEAIERMAERAYDLVLMDMQMPVMDGVTATERIRANASLRQPIILALTANAMKEDEARCLAAGMDGFLAKPVRLQALREAIESVTARLRAAA